ncbi:hypothetical protein SAMN02910384_03255 [Pseudobutyrivibrio sp. ACV-2]|uniref:hypothetical protein n=1 Tax=Pseudobutyrivibrio sp. ACV-2 TaxID=1520801 RepID=UPI000894F865|nr:hypothetical protein [Pseudobutyrivibrio sp. ACV-2]SEB06009.1 hypothetical protein SAMN02910384_03255 [Pseudobutyrivibrio sp. ACV-2]
MKNRLDKGLILSFAGLSLLFSVGIIFFILFIFNIDIAEHTTGIVGSYSGMSGVIWLILLCRNC